MPTLPLQGYHSLEHYVENLDRARKFYCDVLGFKCIGRSSAAARQKEGMDRLVLAGGPTIHIVLSAPLTEWSVAALYLKQHPEGIGFLNFRVSNLEKAVDFLSKRKATFLFDAHSHTDQHGALHQIAMASALDDVNYRLIEDHRYQNFGPSFEMQDKAGSYQSPYGFECIDHLTSNVRTLQPLVSFYQNVLGFEPFWEIAFHTNDVNPGLPVGSGLYSQVMWHPDSGIKFANNEPARPSFRNSQIDIYCRDNRGSGVQHVALRVPDIIPVTSKMRGKGAKFLPAPEKYYEMTPARLKKTGFTGEIAEDMRALAKDNILLDASSKGYLLQIFSMELSRQFDDDRGGPLFFEIIQREGDDGFGGGNFRALFETIELDQMAMARTAKELPLELI